MKANCASVPMPICDGGSASVFDGSFFPGLVAVCGGFGAGFAGGFWVLPLGRLLLLLGKSRGNGAGESQRPAIRKSSRSIRHDTGITIA